MISKLLKKTGLISYFLLTSLNNYAGFLDDQLRYSRVEAAYSEKLAAVIEKLEQTDLKVTDFELMIKIYKYEEQLKVYAREKTNDQWFLVCSYEFCASSGTPGPKIREWDGQIPEGYYHVSDFNPHSSFLLSLGVSYPNAADKLRFPAQRKGDGIYIHGGCATIGCVPIRDEPIKELYIFAVLARDNGQTKIPVHIFPFEYSPEKMKVALSGYPDYSDFWGNLYEAEIAFDSTHIQPAVGIDKQGNYFVSR